jgi:hypothetical protein
MPLSLFFDARSVQFFFHKNVRRNKNTDYYGVVFIDDEEIHGKNYTLNVHKALRGPSLVGQVKLRLCSGKYRFTYVLFFIFIYKK